MKKNIGIKNFVESLSIAGILLMPGFASGSVATNSSAITKQNQIDPVPYHVVMPDDVVSNQPWSARNQEGSLFVALFGDSVSLGTMADAPLGSPGPRYYADFMGSIAAGSVYDFIANQLNHKPTEAEAHNLLQKHFGNMARKNLSPYLGTQDYSLPVLIHQKSGYTPKVYNGAQMAGSYYFSHIYLDKFEKFYTRNPFHKKPDIVIVNFNGMDFMDAHPASVYQEKVRSFYQRLTKLAPHAKIIVTGIKDPVPLLTYPDRIAVPHSPFGPIKCSTLYKVVRFANSTGLYPGAPQEAIDAAYARLEAFRGILEAEVKSLNDDRFQYPEFQGKAFYMDPTGDDGITADMIAADCIHPNKEAQRIIGEKFWDFIEPLL